MSAEDIVGAFIGAIEKGDVEGALQYMADDCEYDNVPMAKAIGHEEIRNTLAMFVSPDNPATFKVLRQAVSGDLVMNERIDSLKVAGKPIEVKVAGVWEVHAGKITLWRDYFDMGELNSQLS